MNEAKTTFDWDAANFWKRLSREFRLAFLAACVVGVATHLYVFSNLLLSNDGVNHAFKKAHPVANGRWMLNLLSGFTPEVQTPVTIGLLSIVLLAIATGLTVRFLELSHPASIVLTAAALVSFPSVANIFAYMFTADLYFCGLLFNALAVYLCKKYRFGWLAAIGLLALGCAVYQAFLDYAIGLLLFDCILALLNGEAVKPVLRRGAKYILVILAGLLLYYVTMKIYLHIHGTELSSYQNMETMDDFNFAAYFAAVPSAYRVFARVLIRLPMSVLGSETAQVVFYALFFAAAVFLVIARRLWKEPVRLLLLLLGGALIPLALNLVTVFVFKGSIHGLMIYSFVLLPVLGVKVIETAVIVLRQTTLPKNLWKGVLLTGSLCFALMIWNNISICNISYHGLQLCYETTFAMANRIVMHVESTEGSTPDTPIALVGTLDTALYGTRENHLPYVKGFQTSSYETVFCKNFIKHYLGVNYSFASSKELSVLAESDAVAAMPSYPQEGSIDMVDGFVVVKLSDVEGNKK